MKMRLKVSSAKWRPFYLGLNVLRPRSFVVFGCGLSPIDKPIYPMGYLNGTKAIKLSAK